MFKAASIAAQPQAHHWKSAKISAITVAFNDQSEIAGTLPTASFLRAVGR
ncbi:hypothetical protein [Rubripirellula tenax]|nr:hypothetical protein [Rubripirellula tenax]